MNADSLDRSEGTFQEHGAGHAMKRRVWRQGLATALSLGVLWGAGCQDGIRQVGKRVRHHVVRTVVDQGLTLDENAVPQKVVYVLLCAIRDDYAARIDAEAREAAFDRQLALCAPDHIYARALRQSVGRDEAVQRIVWRWAPTLGHYRNDFPTGWDRASQRLVTARTIRQEGPTGSTESCRVLLELASPTGDANKSVVAQFQLHREKGFWRVAQVGFVKGIRHLTPELLAKLTRPKAGDSG